MLECCGGVGIQGISRILSCPTLDLLFRRDLARNMRQRETPELKKPLLGSHDKVFPATRVVEPSALLGCKPSGTATFVGLAGTHISTHISHSHRNLVWIHTFFLCSTTLDRVKMAEAPGGIPGYSARSRQRRHHVIVRWNTHSESSHINDL